MRTPVWLVRSLTMLAIGAILALAVTVHVRYLDIQTAGGCLFSVGALDLFLNLGLLLWSRRARSTGYPPSAAHDADPDRTSVLPGQTRRF